MIDRTRPAPFVINQAKGQLEMDGRLVKVLENNGPVLRTLDNMLNNPKVFGSIVFPDIETFIEKTTGQKDTISTLNEIFGIISRSAGFKFREIQMDEEEQRKNEMLMRRAEVYGPRSGRSFRGIRYGRRRPWPPVRSV